MSIGSTAKGSTRHQYEDTKPVGAKHLGITVLIISSMDSLQQAATPTPSDIDRRKGMTSEAIPYIVEFVFGLHRSGLTQGAAVSRKFISGANWASGSAIHFALSG